MIRKIIIRSNRRVAAKMILYTSMFTGLFMAYFLLMSFNGMTDAENKCIDNERHYTQVIDSLQAELAIQSKLFWDSAASVVPLVTPIAEEDIAGVLGEFGYRVHPIYKVRRFHYGLDFPAEIGTPVHATGAGTIESAGMNFFGYGNKIVLSHGLGYTTVYAHLKGFAVREGQSVQRGDVIGFVGSTGLSTAPHLHYEVVLNGEKVNPQPYCEHNKVLLLAVQ